MPIEKLPDEDNFKLFQDNRKSPDITRIISINTNTKETTAARIDTRSMVRESLFQQRKSPDTVHTNCTSAQIFPNLDR